MSRRMKYAKSMTKPKKKRQGLALKGGVRVSGVRAIAATPEVRGCANFRDRRWVRAAERI